jgi:NADH:ubiquinone oxidoreductase subunit 4 (subunit M)
VFFNQALIYWLGLLVIGLKGFIILRYNGGFSGVVVYDWVVQMDKVRVFFVLLMVVIFLVVVIVRSGKFYVQLFYYQMFFVVLYFLRKKYLMLYVFFELRVIPIFILVILYGKNPERLRASMYMILYTLVGSIPLLVRILVVWGQKVGMFRIMIREIYIPEIVKRQIQRI